MRNILVDLGNAAKPDGIVQAQPRHYPHSARWVGRLGAFLLLCSAALAAVAQVKDVNSAGSIDYFLPVQDQCSTSYVVNTLADAGNGSLRQAVADVCAGGTVVFAPTLTASGPATITLSSDVITLTRPLTITGPGADWLAISGNRASRILAVEDGVDAMLSGLTLRDGASTAGGGAIHNLGALTLHHVRLTHNISTHPASDQGGGAIYSRGALTVSNSVFFSNTARYGGAIFCDGVGGGTCRLDLRNVTFVGNAATTNGGALHHVGAASVRLTNVILWANTALAGRQIYNNNTTPVIDYSVVAEGDSGSGGDSGLSAFTDGVGNSAADPYLADLTSGDVRLLPGSSAIDAGADCPADDLSGVARPQPSGGACDIGAYEAQPFTLIAGGGAGQSAIVGAPFAQPLTLTVVSATGAPVLGGRIIFTGPVSGASMAPAIVTGTITNGGLVNVSVSANSFTGTYPVVATAPGVAEAIIYTLTNLSNATTTTLTGARNPSVVGEPVILTATVTANAPEAGTPTGVVTFTIAGATIPAPLSGGVATYLTTTLPVGEHPVAAVYGGGAYFEASVAAPFTQTVGKASTMTTLTSAPNPATLFQAVQLTATVKVAAPGAGAPGGVVTFMAGATSLGSSAIGAGGVATFTTSALAVGDHLLTAIYAGDASFTASISDPITQTVLKIATTTTLVTAPATSVFGEPITLTATVTAADPGVGAPTGVVTFTAGATVLGSSVVDAGGMATLTTNSLAVGVHTLLATYGGDAVFAASADDVDQHVNKAGTTITLVGAPVATIYGQPVAYTATVSILAPGAGALSGAVTFASGITTLGGVPVDANGVATLTTTGLIAGVHPITAMYGADASFAESVSAVVTQTVSQATTTLTVATAPNPAPAQSNVAFTATIGVVAPGGGAPTGIVTFTAGSTVFTATAVDGVAVGYLATLDVGVHPVSALYAGNHNYMGSAATGGDQTILCLPTAIVTHGADASLGSLRRAIKDLCVEGEIGFNVAAPITITLTGGALTIGKNLTITGPGPELVAVSGAGLSRLFVIEHGVSARIGGLTLRDGRVPAPENGGAIYNQGVLTLTHCALLNNRAGANGGALYNHFSQLDVRGCYFQANSAGYWGGAIAAYDGTLTIADSLLAANSAGYWGGGVLVNAGTHAVGNATFTQNSAGYSGGGLSVLNGALTAANVTFVGNSAFMGGAVSNQSGQLVLRNAIVSDSQAGGNCAGAIINGGANLESSATCAFGAASSNIDAMFAPLGDYGGDTYTYALLPGSPAIDAGDAATCAASPVDRHDQRGVVRPQGAACDIGAFESRGFTLNLSGAPQQTLTGSDFAQPLQVMLGNAGGEPTGPGGLVVFTPPTEGAGINLYTPFTLTTDAGGVVSATVTANEMAGSYAVTATTRGALTPTVFLLTNRLRNLSVGKVGDGVGAIASDPPGIDCGPVCATAFDPGATVTLTAQAAVGSTFGGWEGCDLIEAAVAPSCRVTVQTLSRITATFQLNLHPITVTALPGEGGQVAGGGSYRHGFPVIVAATPNPGYLFSKWTEDGQEVSLSSHYAFTATAPRTLIAHFVKTAPSATAVNDITTALAGRQVEIPVLTNDVDSVGAGLTLLAITQPAHGVAAINERGQTVRYLATDFSGVDLFTYTVRDGNGYTDTATVAVVVQTEPGLWAETRTALIDPTVENTVHFTGAHVAMTIALPAGFYTDAMQAGDVLFLRYTTILTPTAETGHPPGGLHFGNLLFDLTLYHNNQPLHAVNFASPLVVAITYDPATLSVDSLSLQLLYWNGTEWRPEGITLLSHDATAALFTVALSHLSEFAFFGVEITPGDAGLYLPLVMSETVVDIPPAESGDELRLPDVDFGQDWSGVAPDEGLGTDDAATPAADHVTAPVTNYLHLPVIMDN
ncbi:MAG TPA: cadherin-like domain-containing protein [Chloroflexi bacterium]|nr:cadherin-like domain-containing protein [Chloroflexota bacterium]